ncbi:hypothetical protein PT974_10298 [Cladobotryum mycophilum]|uniref:Subtilisin-like serine protease n=1 Tax=Cladobotryum mycophilum TaxID=491253 RepID=A0ABR0SAW6_9HYPO
MAQPTESQLPVTTNPLQNDNSKNDASLDDLPASYHCHQPTERGKRRIVMDPSRDLDKFLATELCLDDLAPMLKNLWFAGIRRPPNQLHHQVTMGRKIVATDRIDLHLMWASDGRIFIKPLPRFLLDPYFWTEHLQCSKYQNAQCLACEKCHQGGIARGLLYSYACLVSSETDFHVAKDHVLLPRGADNTAISWQKWKIAVREILQSHNPDLMHTRFLRGELRLSRINTMHRLMRLSPFAAYFGRWTNYSTFFRDNLHWIAGTTVWVALVLAAMQVGFSTDLQHNDRFQRASYVVTLIALFGPLGLFGLVILGALYYLVTDLPWLFMQRLGKHIAGEDTKQSPFNGISCDRNGDTV